MRSGRRTVYFEITYSKYAEVHNSSVEMLGGIQSLFKVCSYTMDSVDLKYDISVGYFDTFSQILISQNLILLYTIQNLILYPKI